ncbi:hypothetical protein [Reichenbachiella sp. MSK19-1]|uniref:hypothetical protein n=1 Tax=Reichenbachiella sp. MSK19-1 TaxID=1897631 RepID=UPI000E6B97B5|nr:hypothetical protein [Reichenbachiella sp. MSK19-1]RJE75450.1 hypothetical protein BGP76_16855 [Reichenbachiella sp. MSK19-1]
MDIDQLFQARFNKSTGKEIAQYILAHPDQMSTLTKHFLGKNARACQNAAWVLSTLNDMDSNLTLPYLGTFIDHLDTSPIDAVKRNTLRVLQFQDIPEEYQGKLVDHCFHYLTDQKQAIAVHAFAMTVLANLCVIYPDLKNELRLVVEDLMRFGSAAIQSRGKKVLKLISQ